MDGSMKGVIKDKLGGGKKGKVDEGKKVFGVALDRNCKEIPHILETCVVYLDGIGLDLEGIFRKSGSLLQMNDYKAKFDRGTSFLLFVIPLNIFTYSSYINTTLYIYEMHLLLPIYFMGFISLPRSLRSFSPAHSFNYSSSQPLNYLSTTFGQLHSITFIQDCGGD